MDFEKMPDITKNTLESLRKLGVEVNEEDESKIRGLEIGETATGKIEGEPTSWYVTKKKDGYDFGKKIEEQDKQNG